MKKHIITFCVACMIYSMATHAQYYSDRPLEKSFEQSDLFFSPSFLNPMGTENFGSATILTSDHPLNALQRNPANLSQFDQDSLPSNYLYIDLRNTRNINKNGYGGVWPAMSRYSQDYYSPGWGYYHTTSRSELAPIVSVAYLTRLPVFKKSLTAGITYQLINQAEGYYAVPQDIYRNLAGKTADGMAYAGMESYTITDRFSGSDDMYHEGHAINSFLAWEINDAFKAGIKIGTFIFERDGSLGSNNLWNQQVDYQSHWKSFEDRSQEYQHWDYALGLEYSLNSKNKLGIFAGMVTGNVNQAMTRDDESMSKSGIRGTSNWSDYQSWYKSDQSWDHKGKTVYTGLHWEKQIREDLGFRFIYNYSSSMQDLGLNSSIESESQNEYYYSGTSNSSESEGFSDMHDFRSGSGERTINNHKVNAAFLWKLQDNQKLSVGAIVGVREQNTNTTEIVDAFSESEYISNYVYNSNSHTYEYYNKTVEDKTIQWKFTSGLRSFQVPVIYEYKINQKFELLLGLNRVMNFWKIENSSLILYDYRERINNQQTLIEEMTGERITEPRERLSIITTSFLSGVTFSPSRYFNVRLVASPGFEKNSLMDEQKVGMQFWISMSFRP